MNFCQFHPTLNIIYICIASHKCHRKLCALCLEKHRLIDNTYYLDTFHKQVEEKLEQFQPNNGSKQKQIKIGFKSIFDQFEKLSGDIKIDYNNNPNNSLTNKLKTDFKNQLNKFSSIMLQRKKELDEKLFQFFNSVNQVDQFYLSLNKINAAHLSYQELDNLAKILLKNGFEQWQFFSYSAIQKLEQAVINLNLQIEKFQAKNNIQNYEKQERDIILQQKQLQNCLIWNEKSHRFQPTQFKILKKNTEIQYILDGEIIRIDLIRDSFAQVAKFNNLEQLKHLDWSGNYDKNNNKNGKWNALWKGENLDNVGGQYINGKKQGQWKEIISNYWSLAQIYEEGKYVKDKRQGNWVIKRGDNKIGGGKYNQKGEKQGNWVDIIENFFNQCQVTQNGEYNMNGMKVGKWEIMYLKLNEKEYKQIGGGSYDQEGNQKKIRKWVELDENFSDYHEVTHIGEFNMSGFTYLFLNPAGFWQGT